jgi:hypothetical protein
VKLPRITVRRLAVLVALAALCCLVPIRLRQRSAEFERRANEHYPGAMSSPTIEKMHYHVGMLAKYQHAARYPWLPVAPDPPEPE